MAKKVLPLSDSKIKSTISAHKKSNFSEVIKLRDGDGLYLKLDTKGGMYWLFDYTRPIIKKRNTLSFGTYPELSLADARLKRTEVRSLIARDIDPAVHKQRENDRRRLSDESTFSVVADKFRETEELKESSQNRNSYIWDKLYLSLGNKPIADITALDVLDTCRIYENQGKFDSAKRMRSKASHVFKYAIVLGLCKFNVADQISGILKSGQVNHYAAITDEAQLGKLLADIEVLGVRGSAIVNYALKIMPHVFIRPGELRNSKWSDVDFDKNVWAYTPSKTENQTFLEHVIPLSSQVRSMLEDLHKLTGQGTYLFPSYKKGCDVISDSTLNKRLKKYGFENGETTGHGMRATARTLLDEVLGFKIERIEQQLAHQVKDMHGRAYNRTKYLKERAEMMQVWSDYLDDLKAKALAN